MKRLVVMTIVCAFISAPAFADLYGTVAVDWKGLIRGASVLELTTPFGSDYPEQSVGLHLVDLGPLDTTGATHALPTGSFLVQGMAPAFCIDLQDAFPAITKTYNASSLDVLPDVSSGGPMGVDKAQYIAQLLNANAYGTAAEAAAVQVAIWEIIYDTTWDTTTGNGNFYLDTAGNTYGEAAIAAAANSMLSGLSKASSFSQYTGLGHDVGKANQDFVLVPVPGAVLLGILGLGAVGLKLRKYA